MISFLINLLIQALSLIIIVYVVLSYFMRPDHEIRRTIDRIVDPMLAPIRRVVPPLMGLDFSPVILLLVVSLVGNLLAGLFHQIGL